MNYLDSSGFLSDDLFIQWRLSQSAELTEYWNNYIGMNPASEPAFREAIEKFGAVRINQRKLDDERSEQLLQRIMQSSRRSLRRRRTMRYTAVAACFLLAAVPVFLLRDFGSGPATDINTIIGQPLPPEDIQLITGGNVLAIKSNAEISLSEKGVVSIVEAGNSEVAEVDVQAGTVHKLIVPRGKRSTLTLPDGSKVWLNAGTVMEFTAKFPKNERNIKVDGEIYIDVAHDSERPFFVHTDQMTVRVYGTKFNVSSYHDARESSVVLVEGKVVVLHQGEPQLLNPGEMFSLSGGVSEHREVDVDYHTSWINGILRLNKTPVAEILEKISRYYNVDFRNGESHLMTRTCSGTLILSDNVEEVIQSVCLISGAGFERDGDTIYINDKRLK